MSKLARLMGKSKEYELEGEMFTLHPLSMKDVDLVLGLEKESTRADCMKKIIHKTLMKSVPDATKEEIDAIGMKYFKELTDFILDVNGMNEMVETPPKVAKIE